MSRPVSVAFVLGSCGLGGTEAQSQLLVRGLRSRGIDVDVYVVEGPVPDPSVFGGARVVQLTNGRGAGVRGPALLALAALRLRRSIGRRRYDVVHAALARAYVIAPLAAPWRQRPLVVAWRRDLGTHLAHRGPTAVLERVATRLTDVVVANSAAVQRYWTARWNLPPERVRTVPNALEPWRFDTVAATVHAVPTRLVSVGRLREVKGHDVLLDAAARLRDRGLPVEVVVVGDGPCRESLTEQAHRLGVPLTLPGHVGDPRAWLASAGVYVHPSRSEGASNAIAEAMAQGCAIVATDVGGSAEMLAGCGMVVPPDDPETLAGVLEAVLDDRAMSDRLGLAARVRARDLFSLDRVLDAHVAIYLSRSAG